MQAQARPRKKRALSGSGLALREELRERIVQIGWSRTAQLSGVDRVTLHRAFGGSGGRLGLDLATAEAVAETFGLRLALADKGLVL